MRQRAGDGGGRGWGWGCNYFALSNPKITRLPQLQSGPHYAALQKRGRNTRPIKTKRESRDGREDNISTAGVDLTCLRGECLCATLAACHVLPRPSNVAASRLLSKPSFYRSSFTPEAPDSRPGSSHVRMHFAPPGKKSPLKHAAHFLPPVRRLGCSQRSLFM